MRLELSHMQTVVLVLKRSYWKGMVEVFTCDTMSLHQLVWTRISKHRLVELMRPLRDRLMYGTWLG